LRAGNRDREGERRMEAQPVEIYAIRYGRLARFGRDNLLLCPELQASEPMPIDYYFWVLKSLEKTFVVDTGYSPALATKLGRKFECDPMDALRDIGVEPARVENVILTHLHYDHAGNIGEFNNAHFYFHEAELPFSQGWYAREPAFAFLYAGPHIAEAASLVQNGRATLLNGDFEIAPGVQLVHIPGHSPGHMALRVWTRRGWVVLAVDASHFKANMIQRRPYPLYLDLAQIMAGYDKLQAIAPDLDHIVCGHDSTTIDVYPAASSGLKGKIARLDLPPTQSD
jgi:glyoxylase-like metal-dependent hydrolase (beta-lactamase superfamily II)